MSPSNDACKLSLNGRVATLLLNAPNELNAMSEAMSKSFDACLAQIKKNKNIGAVILTGAGRAFSSGGHLEMLLQKTKQTRKKNEADMKAFYARFLKIRTLPQPVLAAINGPAFGAGFCLALACDYRLASDSATLALNFAKLGLAPGMGALATLHALVGTATASDLLFTGRTIGASEAKSLGLVHEVLPADQLMNRSAELASHMASFDANTLRLIKQAINQIVIDPLLKKVTAFDAKAQAACFASPELRAKLQKMAARVTKQPT